MAAQTSGLWMTSAAPDENRHAPQMAPETPSELCRRPFTLDQARALGLTERQLRHRRFRRLHRGVYVSAGVSLTAAVRAQAVALLLGDVTFSHQTAAQLANLPVPPSPCVHVTVEPGSPCPQISNVRVHRLRLAAGDAHVVDGRRVTTPARTWLDLASAGLPRPEAGLDLLDEFGQWVARPDLLYRQPPVILQYDGATHFRDERQRRHDVVRDELTRELGYEVVVVTADDLLQPHRLVDRVRAARERAIGRQPKGRLVSAW
jgi:hypothetical protein